MKWQKKTVGEVCRLINGRAYKKRELLSRGPYRVLRVGNFFTKDHWYYSDLELEPDKYCDDGDLLYAWSASFGPRFWSGEKVLYHYHIWKVETRADVIDSRFLFWFFDWDKERIKKDQGAGTTMIHVSKGSMEAREIAIPPLAVQRWIIGILDEAFAGIATAKANAEKNLRNARALFESQLDAIFTDRSNGWTEFRLGEVCSFIGGSQPPKSVFEKQSSPDNIRLIQIRDYKSDKHLVHIPRSLARRFCKSDDVMIGRYGPPLFQILRGLDGAYNVALMKAVPDEAKLSRDFLFYFLKHSTMLQYVIFHSERTAGQTGITKETLEPYPIAIPPLKIQGSVVQKIASLEFKTQRLESLYHQKLSALDALKKSLLHQAFSGSSAEALSRAPSPWDNMLFPIF